VKELAKYDGGKNFEVHFHVLSKIRETPHQAKLKNKTDRLKNLKGSFKANAGLVKGRNIILIDDVITTGTTMREAAKTLREAGAKKVIGFAIAH
jgi:predicted amidophosphoribosyltransferase